MCTEAQVVEWLGTACRSACSDDFAGFRSAGAATVRMKQHTAVSSASPERAGRRAAVELTIANIGRFEGEGR